MTAAFAAAFLAAASVALLVPWRGRPGNLLGSAGRTAGAGVTAAGVGLLVVAGTSLVSVRVVVLAAIGAGALLGMRHRTVRARADKAAAARRQRVVDFTEALSGELVAGRPVVEALERAAEVWPEALPVARSARLGADVPEALRVLARQPGAEGVARLAAAWQLTASSGAGLAGAARRVLETARARQSTERLVVAEVASARATARLVGGLPVLVLLGAQGAGARPWVFLTGHPLGLTCLGVGLFLSWLGLAWIDRIAGTALEGAD